MESCFTAHDYTVTIELYILKMVKMANVFNSQFFEEVKKNHYSHPGINIYGFEIYSPGLFFPMIP